MSSQTTTVRGIAAAVVLAALAGVGLMCCGGETPAPAPAPEPAPAKAKAKAKPEPPPAPVKKERPAGPLPAMLMVQSWFPASGEMKPQPAKLTIWRTDGNDWFEETVLDDKSSVFHKAVPWRGGILTAGAGLTTGGGSPAKLAHWTPGDDGWSEKVLWSQKWDGKFHRLRDFEIGDLDGDGKDEIAIATHDMGVVAVADEGEDGSWTVVEHDKKADTFVHEIEIGDVDGDGKKEFYCTPSGRNKSSGESQAGGVARYHFEGGKYVRSDVVWWEESHAKEILVADMDGDGTDELYVVKEGHVAKKGKRTKLIDPVNIVRMTPGKGGKWTETVVAKLEGEPQTRFLFAGDMNGDGKPDMVAAAKDTGLWLLTPKGDGTFDASSIDKQSGGFEHASVAGDLDGDGKPELYVAADKQTQFRRYTWNGQSWDRELISKIPPKHITWNLAPAKL